MVILTKSIYNSAGSKQAKKKFKKHWVGSVDQAAKRKRTLSSGVLGEAASSLANRMLTLSADNIEISKINIE